MLTIEKLKLLKPGIFAQGEVNNDELPVPMVNPLEYPDAKFKWIASRGVDIMIGPYIWIITVKVIRR